MSLNIVLATDSYYLYLSMSVPARKPAFSPLSLAISGIYIYMIIYIPIAFSILMNGIMPVYISLCML